MFKFVIGVERQFVTIAVTAVVILSLGSSAVFGADDIKKIKRLVARVQLELSQIKENSLNSAQEQLAVLEPQNEKIETLEGNNRKLTEKISALELKIALLEENLEKYQSKSSSAQLSELNQLSTVFALVSVGDVNSIEPIVLELSTKETMYRKIC